MVFDYWKSFEDKKNELFTEAKMALQMYLVFFYSLTDKHYLRSR